MDEKSATAIGEEGRTRMERTLAPRRIEALRVQTWLNKLMQSNGRKRYLQLCQLALCRGKRGSADRVIGQGKAGWERKGIRGTRAFGLVATASTKTVADAGANVECAYAILPYVGNTFLLSFDSMAT